MRILHIANWYPNRWNEHEGIFIREQFNAFSRLAESKIVNVQVRPGKKWFEYIHFVYNEKESAYFVLTKIKKSKVIELMTTLLVLWVLRKEQAKTYNLLNVHIAYPLLIHYRWWKKWLGMKLIISEHWSAYHFNFWIPLSSRKIDNIKRIFRQQIPVVTVSKALLEDLRKFSNTKDFDARVIPNVIDQRIYHFRKKTRNDETIRFFMVNIWRDIKNPYPVIDACVRLIELGIPLQLVLGGDGPLLTDMTRYVEERKAGSYIIFTGAMNKERIAEALSESDAYLFSSNYETFSVACAQALCCGVPIVGPAIPAIMEYADDSVMTTVAENNAAAWQSALRQFIEKRNSYHREVVAERATKRFATDSTVEQYRQFVASVVR